MARPVTCWVLDHPAHLQLFRSFLSGGSKMDILVATKRPEVEAMLGVGDTQPLAATNSPLPARETIWVERPAGAGLLPLQREWRAWNRIRAVRKVLVRRRVLGHPVHRVISKGAPLELRAAKRARVSERWYITDTEIHHLAHRLALSAATDVVLPADWREDLDGGFLLACKERGTRVHLLDGHLPHAYLQPPHSRLVGDGESTIPRVLHRALAGGGAHDKAELVSAASLIPDLGMKVTTVAENKPINDPWGLPSLLPDFDGVLSESVTVAHEAVCQGVPTLLVSKAQRGFLDPFLGGGLLFQIESTVKGPALNNEVAAWREAVVARMQGGAAAVVWSDAKNRLNSLWS
jgi:hypothetical protein